MKKRCNFTAKQLKLIAMILMFMGHFANIFLQDNAILYIILRGFGRFVFPINAYLLAIGDRHTKNRKKYILRILVFAVISELFYDYAFYGRLVYLGNQNILFTMTLGEITLYVFNLINENISNSNKRAASKIAAACISAFLAEILRLDYGASGIILIVLFSILWKENMTRREEEFAIEITSIICAVLWIINPGISKLQLFAIIAIIFIIPKYNGQRGNIKHKKLYYMYYSCHLVLLSTMKLLTVG